MLLKMYELCSSSLGRSCNISLKSSNVKVPGFHVDDSTCRASSGLRVRVWWRRTAVLTGQ